MTDIKNKNLTVKNWNFLNSFHKVAHNPLISALSISPYSTLAVIVALLLSVFYFFYILIYVTEKTWDTATNFVTTVLSIVIGGMISVIIYNYQQKQQSEHKFKELLINLERELSDINQVLTSGEVIKVDNLSFLVTYIQPIIIDECAKSGLFEPRDVENLLHFSRKIKFYNVQVSHFLSILANSDIKRFSYLLENSNRNMETSRIALIDDIKTIITHIRSLRSKCSNP